MTIQERMARLRNLSNADRARILGVTVEQVQAQHAKCAPDIAGMARKARATGRKVNGFTAAELEEMASRIERLSRED